MSVILWFRRDLRLDDHPALQAALATQSPIIPVYIDDSKPSLAEGGASRWWLDGSLRALATELEKRGSRLIVRRGSPREVLSELCLTTGAQAVYWTQRYEPQASALDQILRAELMKKSCRVYPHPGSLLFEPHEIRNKENTPYRVFTPFWRACLGTKKIEAPLPAPQKLPAPAHWPDSLSIDELGLKPQIPWDQGMAAAWTPGELSARKLLADFQQDGVSSYVKQRDIPSLAGTSRLSPHLAFGEISPRRIWATFQGARPAIKPGEDQDTGAAFLRQIGWREFAYHLLVHFPATVDRPLRPEFERFPWLSDAGMLKAWQRGRTGFPIVDAGMRELWTTGWMHNRVRMIVGSFLVKDLLLPWQEGAAWFWDTLVDADLANNTLGWQWIGGCGADAAPYFRVFNPQSQAEKFDPEGIYIKRWIPELARLPAPWIHSPEKAPLSVLREAGVTLDRDYPYPIVDHGEARMRALVAYEKMRHPPQV